MSFGRIGALPSYPAQIKIKELNGLLTFPIKESAIVTWLQNKISGFNFQLVTCVNDEPHVEEYLQFRISAATPDSFPNHVFFCWRLLGLIPGGAPFSQLSSGVKDAMVVCTRLVKCHFMTKTCKKAVRNNTQNEKEVIWGTVHRKCKDSRRGLR